MLVVTDTAVRDPDGPSPCRGGVAGAVIDVVGPEAAAEAVIVPEEADADVGGLALAEGGGVRTSDLGTNPDGGVGFGGELEAALDSGGVGGDRPGEVDAAGGSDGMDADVGGDRSGEGAGGEEDGGDEELRKHFV